MNLFIFISFIFFGIIGCNFFFLKKNVGIIYKILFIGLFILCGISRIGHTKDISDLTYYIDYFENDIVQYFEPGYIFFTYIVETTLGKNGYFLVFGVGVFISINILISIYLLNNKNSKEFKSIDIFFLFSFLFFIYWGLAFESERIRVGMATSLLVLSTALAYCKYRYYSYIPAILALSFQFTTIAYLPILWIIQRDFKLPSKRTYYLWLIGLLIFDFVTFNFQIYNSLFVFSYLKRLQLDQISHYMEYETFVVAHYDLQYFWYHFAPLLFLIGDFRNKDFNKGVLIYFMGLTLSSLLQNIPAGHRIADLFYIMIIFPIVFSFMENGVSVIKKKRILYIYITVQAVMCARYLGLSL